MNPTAADIPVPRQHGPGPADPEPLVVGLTRAQMVAWLHAQFPGGSGLQWVWPDGGRYVEVSIDESGLCTLQGVDLPMKVVGAVLRALAVALPL